MKLVPVSLAVFYRHLPQKLEVWTQVRTDPGPLEGMLEFPGGGIERNEEPLTAVAREVEEEVGIKVSVETARFMGIYPNLLENCTILLYVFLFPEVPELKGKGHWLQIERPDLSQKYLGKIPPLNHKIIDELYNSLYGGRI